MLFFYDRINAQSGIPEYRNYLDNLQYLYELKRSGVDDIINYQLTEVRRSIAKNSESQQTLINETVTRVCGSLESGFDKVHEGLKESNGYLKSIDQGVDDLNWQLVDLNTKFDDLIYLLDDKLSLSIQQQKTTNDLLNIIAIGISHSDRKKENIIYTEQGNRFLKTAIAEGPHSNWYEKAFQNFQKAHSFDPDDCISLKQLGFVHLHSATCLDVKKAEYYFLESASNAIVFNNYSPDGSLRETSASSYYYASVCNYILGDLANAVRYIKLALSFTSASQTYQFQLAKYYAASGNYDDALTIDLLMSILERDKLWSIKIIEDQDLITKKAVQDMLESETRRLVQLVDAELSKIRREMISDSTYQSLVDSIERAFNPKTYLNARIAKEELGI